MADINFLQKDRGHGDPKRSDKDKKNENKIRWSRPEEKKDVVGNVQGAVGQNQEKSKNKFSGFLSFFKKGAPTEGVKVRKEKIFADRKQISRSREEVLKIIKEHEERQAAVSKPDAVGFRRNFYPFFKKIRKKEKEKEKKILIDYKKVFKAGAGRPEKTADPAAVKTPGADEFKIKKSFFSILKEWLQKGVLNWKARATNLAEEKKKKSIVEPAQKKLEEEEKMEPAARKEKKERKALLPDFRPWAGKIKGKLSYYWRLIFSGKKRIPPPDFMDLVEKKSKNVDKNESGEEIKKEENKEEIITGDLAASGEEEKNKQEEKKQPEENKAEDEKKYLPADILETDLLKEDAVLFFDWRRHIVIATVFTVLAGLILGAGYWALDSWSKKKKEEIRIITEEFEKAAQEIKAEEKGMQEISDFQNRLKLAGALLNTHIYWTDFFKFLEENTIAEVYYVNFNGENTGKYKIPAQAKNFNSIAKQLKVMRASNFVTEAGSSGGKIAVGATKGGASSVSFEFNLSIDQNIFKK